MRMIARTNNINIIISMNTEGMLKANHPNSRDSHRNLNRSNQTMLKINDRTMEFNEVSVCDIQRNGNQINEMTLNIDDTLQTKVIGIAINKQ